MHARTTGLLFAAFVLAGCGASTPPPKALADTSSGDQTSAELSPPEQALRDRARALLEDRLGQDAKRIRVDVRGTNLTLSGFAPDRHERDRAREIAHEVPGVTRVDIDRLAVR